MKKRFYIIIFLLFTVYVYAEQVDSTNYGIANASPGDYIIRQNGEMVVLKQADIDYAKEQLGLNNISTMNPLPIIALIVIGIIFFIKRITRKSKYFKKVYSPVFYKKLPYENDTDNKKITRTRIFFVRCSCSILICWSNI